jgi:SNF2 family DNA or RNA helicase
MRREEFKFATEPLSHQASYFERIREREFFSNNWEQGLGKSFACITEVAWLYSKGLIDGLLVLAPNGVHANWIDDEIPRHLHESVVRTAHTYYSQKAKTIKAKQSLQACIDAPGLAVLVMSYDALMTDGGRDAAKAFLTKRHAYYVADEFTRIKNPVAQRTKRALASSKYAAYRRGLSGTPVANGPFDVYSPMKFLDPDFWKKHGPFGSFGEFKNCFGIFKDSTNPATGRLFKQCVAYRNLPYLRSLMKDDMERLLKKDVLDLPEKIYQRRYYEMTPAQKKLYDELEETAIAIHDDDMIDGTLPIVRMIRQYQVLCGYLPTEDDSGDNLKLIGEKNPRLDCLFDALPDYDGKKIVWCKWTKDVDLIMDRARKLKIKAVRYDGQVPTFERKQNLNDFRNIGDIELFVTKQSVAGEGLTIVEATTSFYYSNDWPLGARLQSEDRNHRIGQFNPVTYVDICALGTKDMDIVEALQKKIEIACVILGDESKAWIGNKYLLGQAQEASPLDDAPLMVEDDAEAYAKFFRKQHTA